MSGFHTADLYAEDPTARSASGQTDPIDVDAYSFVFVSIHVTDWGDGWAGDGVINWCPEVQDANGIWSSPMDGGRTSAENVVTTPPGAYPAPITVRLYFGAGMPDGYGMLPRWFRLRWELPDGAAPVFQISIQATAADT